MESNLLLHRIKRPPVDGGVKPELKIKLFYCVFVTFWPKLFKDVSTFEKRSHCLCLNRRKKNTLCYVFQHNEAVFCCFLLIVYLARLHAVLLHSWSTQYGSSHTHLHTQVQCYGHVGITHTAFGVQTHPVV